MSTHIVTWVHISDAHFGAPDMTGEQGTVIARLLEDLERVMRERNLKPELLFFTGDLAFGERPGSSLENQYEGARDLLQKIERTCHIARDNMFLVPGNHDVNRTRVDQGQTDWLDALLGGRDDPTFPVDRMWADRDSVHRQRYIERLENYAAFVRRAGLSHLLQDPKRLTYTHRRTIQGVDLAVTGLNTVWSSCRDREKGKLWLGQWQVRSSMPVARNADLAIALGHHPPGWFNEYEEPEWYQTLTAGYHFYLHGHEHNDWVLENARHARVAAGALYERRLTTTGYNFVKVDFEAGKTEVFLRQYDARGGGWIPRCLYGRTDDSGCWTLSAAPELQGQARARISTPPPPSGEQPCAAVIDVFEYFSVALAIHEESRFVGRRSELRVALGALRARGAAVAIFGLAGMGKSSLALELARIANGRDVKLCASPALAGSVPVGGFAHHVVYYSCRRGIDNDLKTTLSSLLSDRVGDFHIGHLLSLPGFDAALERAGLSAMLAAICDNERPRYELALPLFRALGSLVFDFFGKRELVVILDEFNVVDDKSGFATLIKELPQVKFVIVGTGVDVRLLVQDHASIPRQLAEGQIRLRPMSVDELVEVISNEEARSKNCFAFSAQAKAYIADAARGMPFFVHFLARYSLEVACRDHADKDKVVRVELRHVHVALQERLASLADLEGEYVRAVSGRWDREVALKLLSERDEEEIALVNLRVIAGQLGIKRLDTPVSTFVRNGILIQQAAAIYQFSDTRLRIYARLREPLTDEARRKWTDHQSMPAGEA